MAHPVCCTCRFLFFPRILQEVNEENDNININCVDPLGRSALLMAIDNENLDMVDLLITYNVDTKDALLHAISEEFVEAVEMLLDNEDQNQRKEGQAVSIAIKYTCICRKKESIFQAYHVRVGVISREIKLLSFYGKVRRIESNLFCIEPFFLFEFVGLYVS